MCFVDPQCPCNRSKNGSSSSRYLSPSTSSGRSRRFFFFAMLILRNKQRTPGCIAMQTCLRVRCQKLAGLASPISNDFRKSTKILLGKMASNFRAEQYWARRSSHDIGQRTPDSRPACQCRLSVHRQRRPGSHGPRTRLGVVRVFLFSPGQLVAAVLYE